jgi:hypothetical protein
MTRITVVGALLLSVASAVAQSSSGKITTNPVPLEHATPELGPQECDGSRLPMKLPTGPAGPVSCCRGRDDVMVHIGRTKESVAFRLLGTPCTMYGGPEECSVPGAQQCAVGPCGASIEGVLAGTLPPGSPGSEAHVFRPKHAGKACGHQVTLGTNQFAFYPERYDDQNPQTAYPEVTPACPYTACLGHRPAITITVIGVEDMASGHVESDPPGISLPGAGTASNPFADSVTLTAHPKSSHARAVFSSGGCSVQGEYGHKAKCTVPLAPDPEITVTYQCKPGLHCAANEPSPPPN